MAQLKVSLENIIPLTEARDHFSQIVTEVQKDKLYVLTKGGKPAVAIIDVKYLETVTGGSVRQEHIETEIQKDPTKVGRVPMISHNSQKTNDDDEIFAAPFKSPFAPPPVAKPATPPLVFPKTDDKVAVPQAASAAPVEPIKINFQPENNPTSTPSVPTSTPIATNPFESALKTPAAPASPAPTPPIATPVAPIPVPSAPTPPPTATITTTASPLTSQPPTPAAPITPSVATPVAPTQSNPNPANSTIDVIPVAEPAGDKSSLISPDDKPGPAQYAGSANDEPEDMEI